VEALGLWAVLLVREYGYAGLAVGLILNCVGVPVSSEILLPLAGLAVHQGVMDGWLTVMVALAAQMTGLLVSYTLARYGLHNRRAARWNVARGIVDHIHHLERHIHRGGLRLIFVALCLPGLHGLAGYAAGLAGISWWRFVPVALLGSVLWAGAFMGLGYFGGDHIELVSRSLRSFGTVVLIAVAVGWLIWYSKHRRGKIFG
jgi:membrane protein DedA with SNARE-associated domain